jgi:hypothetical protein
MSFADICAAYIAERRAAGCRMDKEERALARLAALHAGMGCPGDALPRALVEAWCAGRPGDVDVHWKVTQMVIGQRAPWSSGIEQIGRGMAVSQASGARPELCFPSGRGLWQEPPGRRKGA